jgi:hypothetical protein
LFGQNLSQIQFAIREPSTIAELLTVGLIDGDHGVLPDLGDFFVPIAIPALFAFK